MDKVLEGYLGVVTPWTTAPQREALQIVCEVMGVEGDGWAVLTYTGEALGRDPGPPSLLLFRPEDGSECDDDDVTVVVTADSGGAVAIFIDGEDEPVPPYSTHVTPTTAPGLIRAVWDAERARRPVGGPS